MSKKPTEFTFMFYSEFSYRPHNQLKFFIWCTYTVHEISTFQDFSFLILVRDKYMIFSKIQIWRWKGQLLRKNKTFVDWKSIVCLVGFSWITLKWAVSEFYMYISLLQIYQYVVCQTFGITQMIIQRNG